VIYTFFYIALIHGKWKLGITDNIFDRFKTYNKGNFNFIPFYILVSEEGFEEGIIFIEDQTLSPMYPFLENPDFRNKPTEYVDPKFTHIDGKYIKKETLSVIDSNPSLQHTIKKLKEQYIMEAVTDSSLLESVRLHPEKYLEGF
jgi:hypothetical protein